MLDELHISQFVTIEELSIQFEQGLHTLTGESGAGKSLIFEAIGLLLGQRGSADYVRKGASKTSLEAQFSIHSTHPLFSFLEAYSLPWDEQEDGWCTLVVQREMTRQGRNTCRINGTLISLQMLREIGSYLVSLYRQHENQRLFETPVQRQWLDAYISSEGKEFLKEYHVLWKEYKRLRREYEEVTTDAKERLHKQDLFQFQYKEITEASLKHGEEEQLKEEKNLLMNVEKIQFGLEKVYSLLSGQAVEAIGEMVTELENLLRYDAGLKPVHDAAREIFYLLEDLNQEVRRKKEDMFYDENRIVQVDERLALIYNLKRKYGDSIEAILEYAASIEQELSSLTHSEEREQELSDILCRLIEEMQDKAKRLSQFRKEAASELSQKVEEELQDLQMENMHFVVEVLPNEKELEEWGCDQVQFKIAPHLGEKLHPFQKIASGGELSRLMLALKTVFQDVEPAETLLFDEIDTGVSGQGALAIAEKLHALSRRVQVICITHLPQVVSRSDVHFLVKKEVNQKGIRSVISRLDQDKRVEELARMLEGNRPSELSMRHAEEMLKFQ